MTTPTIECDPEPGIQGAPFKICYVNGTLPRTLDIVTDPPNLISSPVECPSPGGCVTITMPDRCVQVTIVDPSGEAEYREIPVAPPT